MKKIGSNFLKPKMPSQLPFGTPSKTFSFILISFLLVLSHGFITAADTKTTDVGAIIDLDSRAGKEQKTGMLIAVKNFNNNSKKHKLMMHFGNTRGDPLQAAYSAERLIKEKQVKTIIGMRTWQEAALVADIGKQAQVPVISFAAAAITPPLAQLRWPFLVQMATNRSEEINCVAGIVHSYNWKRVIAIYEDDVYGGESGTLALLSEALRSIGSEIEHRLILPSLSTSILDSKELIHEEVANLLRKNSRVFIVLKASLAPAAHLFTEAKQMGLMGRDSVWIVTDTISSLLDSVDASIISSMQGHLGIKTYYSENFGPFLDFKADFRQIFRSEYPEEDNLEPGIHALRAYDSVTAIAQAVKIRSNTDPADMLLEAIRSSDFTGLSGQIVFDGGKLSVSPVFRIINIVGKSYKELGFWSSASGFSESIESGQNNVHGSVGDSMKILTGSVNWPGDVDRIPKGWAMPTEAKPMKIGVPGRTSFEKFVKVEVVENSDEKKFSGFCIDVFYEVQKFLEPRYALPFEFYAFYGTYDDLVALVMNKTYDAVVGDVTILANRSRYVEFTQPFAESGLSMLVPVKSDTHKAWMFFKPFTVEMWVVTYAVLCYTTFIIWFLEHHQSNPQFNGPWKDQLGTALWFTFSSLFYAHREKVYSNYTKLVIIVWLFVVMVLTSSYTANLSSMLTAPRLEPMVKDISWLKKTNATVGCDGDSFVYNFLKTALELKNIKNISRQEDYPTEFESGNISAAFLELPYEKVFLKQYCKGYTATGPTYRFGGLGFVFQKGSPIAADFSEAILTMSENGVLQSLERGLLGSTTDCLESNSNSTETDSLNLQSFWGIYLITGTTSTVCFVICLVQINLKNRGLKKEVDEQNNVFSHPGEDNGWRKAARLVRNLRNRRSTSRSAVAPAQELGVWPSSRWELVSPTDIPEHLEDFRPTAIEIPTHAFDS